LLNTLLPVYQVKSERLPDSFTA